MTTMQKLHLMDEMSRTTTENFEITKKLMLYESEIDRWLDSPYRKEQDYGFYLKRYFDENESSVDGKDYEHRMRSLPMPYNIYFRG